MESTLLAEADAIAGQDRSRDYGHPHPNHRRIADIWTVQAESILQPGLRFTPRLVALMMVGLKLALQHGTQFLAHLRGTFPKARIIYKQGNHDERWDKYLWAAAPVLYEIEHLQLPAVLETERHGIEMVQEQRPVFCGKLPVFHGHELPRGLASPVNMARGAFMRTLHTVLVGHGHRTSTHSEPNMWHEETVCWSTGCLCELYPEYARINKWNHGFAFNEVAESGEFDLSNLRIAAGKVRRS